MSVKKLSDLTGLAPSTLYGLFDGQQKSSTKLHTIATVIGVHVRWLEFNEEPKLLTSARRESQTLYGIAITQEGVMVGADWEKLREPIRGQLRAVIETLASEAVRDGRPKSPGRRPRADA